MDFLFPSEASDIFYSTIRTLLDRIEALENTLYELRTYNARVIGHADTAALENKHGFGAVKIECPDLEIFSEQETYASPIATPLDGSFIPPVYGSWISIISTAGPTGPFEYLGYKMLDAKTQERYVGFGTSLSIGFTADLGDYYGGPPLTEARFNPTTNRIYQSSSVHLIDLILDAAPEPDGTELSGTLSMRVRNSSRMNILAGDDGEIFIGNGEEETGLPSNGIGILLNAGSATYEPGDSTIGQILMTSSADALLTLSDTGDTELKADSGAYLSALSNGDLELFSDSTGKLKIESSGTCTFNGGAGKVLTTVSDPVVDTITGTPSTGSNYLFSD